MGDPAGIGGEITAKAWLALRGTGPVFLAIDDPDRLGAFGVPLRIIDEAEQAADVFGADLPVLPLALAASGRPGRPDPANAGVVIASIERAVALAQEGSASGVVTNPINKAALYEAGFHHPGHTEFLAELTGVSGQEVMMLASPMLRVVPVSVHVPLRRAVATLSTAAIVAAGRTAAAALRRDFGIPAPRLAVAGLNPHAGEGGALGCEDGAVVAPAVAALREAGIDATGPWPPDTMFTPAARARYDVALCMYHDQALIPLKTLDIDGGVNVTLGLPIIRTSPDHGTAYDIAGKGIASSASLIAALRLAAELAGRRAATGARAA